MVSRSHTSLTVAGNPLLTSRLRVQDRAALLGAQLDPVELRVVDVGDRVELHVVVVVGVDEQAALGVAAVELRDVDLRLQHVVLGADVVRALQEQVAGPGRVAVGVEVADHRRDVQRALVEGQLGVVGPHDRVPLRRVERAVELVARAGAVAATAARVLAVEGEVVERHRVADRRRPAARRRTGRTTARPPCSPPSPRTPSRPSRRTSTRPCSSCRSWSGAARCSPCPRAAATAAAAGSGPRRRPRTATRSG